MEDKSKDFLKKVVQQELDTFKEIEEVEGECTDPGWLRERHLLFLQSLLISIGI